MKSNLNHHIDSIYEEKQPYKCSICKKKIPKNVIWIVTLPLFMKEKKFSQIPDYMKNLLRSLINGPSRLLFSRRNSNLPTSFHVINRKTHQCAPYFIIIKIILSLFTRFIVMWIGDFVSSNFFIYHLSYERPENWHILFLSKNSVGYVW